MGCSCKNPFSLRRNIRLRAKKKNCVYVLLISQRRIHCTDFPTHKNILSSTHFPKRNLLLQKWGDNLNEESKITTINCRQFCISLENCQHFQYHFGFVMKIINFTAISRETYISFEICRLFVFFPKEEKRKIPQNILHTFLIRMFPIFRSSFIQKLGGNKLENIQHAFGYNRPFLRWHAKYVRRWNRTKKNQIKRNAGNFLPFLRREIDEKFDGI